MNNNESGFVLVVVLIFIGILSELILSMMYFGLFQDKLIKDFSIYYQRIYFSDIAFEKIYQAILEENQPCVDRWRSIQLDFLKNGETLNYLITYLETIPCLQVNASKRIGSDFFRVLSVISIGNDSLKIERTFVVESKKNLPCLGDVKFIDAGYLSWRVIR